MNSQSNLLAINERLNLALESSRQIAFDWYIPDDTLHFSGDPSSSFRSVMMDSGRVWNSKSLPAIMHVDDVDQFRQHLHQALKGTGDTGNPYRVELRLRDARLGWRWVEISGRIVERDERGRAMRMVGTFSDIEERKQAELKLIKLRDLYAALSQTNQAIVRIRQREALFREICRIAVEHGHFQMAWIGLTDPESRHVVPVASYGDNLHLLETISVSVDEEKADGQGPIGTAIRENRPQLINDFFNSAHLQFWWDAAQHSDFQSVGSFPFQQNGKSIGALNLYSAERNFFDQALIELLEEMTADISFAIDIYDRETRREAAEAALIESEKFKSAILTAALDCIISIDHEGKIISFNHAAERAFGHRSEDVIGKALAEIIIPPEWRERHRQGMARFLATGESTILNRRIELNAMHANGSQFPVELAIVPIKIQGNPAFTAFIRDITELRQSQTILKESALRYRQLVELSPEAIFVHRHDKFILVNRAGLRLLGAETTTELLGKSLYDFIHPDYLDLVRERVRKLRTGQSSTPFAEQIWLRVDGSEFHAEVAATNVVYDGAAAVQVVARDISERKRSEALQLGQNRILNMVATGVPLPEILNEIALFIESQSNRGLCSIQLLDIEHSALSNGAAPSLPPAFNDAMEGLQSGPSNGSSGTAVFRAEPVIVTDIRHDPLWHAWRDLALRHGLKACSSWPIFGRNRKILGTIGLYFRETTAPTAADLQLFSIATNLAGIAIESRASDEKIRYLAHYDGLTSLPNRFLFKEFLDLALRNAQRHAQKFAVFFLDLDGFKNINDTFGHETGDKVLKEIAARLRHSLRQTDKVARMGGDEFYVLIEDLTDGHYAAEVAQKLLEEASRPMSIDGQECQLSVSIGIVIFPEDGVDGQTLLKNADGAMYRAKDLGKNAYQFFSLEKSIPSPAVTMVGELQLKRAIEHREFVLHYQPKVALETGQIVGVEALVRWQHPERGLLDPDQFIGLAEETGLIVPLGKQILEIAYQDFLTLHTALKKPIRIAVNLSARQLDDNSLVSDIGALLREADARPITLDLEITESMVMPNPEQAVRIMNQLQGMGIRLVIDDFGTGHSSLAYLKRFPVHSLKIDRSFVQDIPGNPNDTAITQAIIAMAHSLGLRVIAEGVETEQQVAALRDYGCDDFQGFYFCKPITLQELIALLKYDDADVLTFTPAAGISHAVLAARHTASKLAQSGR